jgi:hypothetical protein
MADQMGGHDAIRITFDLADSQFYKFRRVLGLIMRGYENQLECDV